MAERAAIWVSKLPSTPQLGMKRGGGRGGVESTCALSPQSAHFHLKSIRPGFALTSQSHLPLASGDPGERGFGQISKQKLWELRNKAGADRGTVDGHGVGITCSDIDGALRTCHSRVQCAALHCTGDPTRKSARHGRCLARSRVRCALRDADLEKCEEHLRMHPGAG
jgi:hypothetical protein